MDIRALTRSVNDPVICRCGNVQGWWTDPIRGTMKVFAKEHEFAKVIGIHNDFLTFAFEHNPLHLDWSNKQWKEHTTAICDSAKGYVFHESLRNCPVAIIGVGVTSDISWESNEQDIPKGKS